MPDLQLPDFQVEHVFATLSETIDWGLTVSNIPAFWKETDGKDVTVCVLDTGCPTHIDLKEAITDCKDFTDSSTADKQGHSTHVCGIIGARKNNIGVIGVAPGCNIIVGKVLSDNGQGNFDWLIKGLEWAIEKKADIVNMSLGANTSSDIHPVKNAIEKCLKLGITLVTAVGNENSPTLNIPARYGTIAVGAMDKNKKKASFSNTGLGIGFVAPGVDIYSTWIDNQYVKSSGSSMAAPIISGICALILSKHKKNPQSKTPITNQSQMFEHLKRLVVDLGSPGYSKDYGYGLVDLSKYQDDDD